MSIVWEHEVRVGWGDCDPAQIAYTARLPAFSLEAIDAWWEAHLDGDGWFQMELDRGYGTPFVSMHLEFSNPVTPRHRLRCEVWPTRLGNKSISFAVVGRQGGVTCFTGAFTCVFIVSETFKSRAAPDEVRAMVEPLIRPAP